MSCIYYWLKNTTEGASLWVDGKIENNELDYREIHETKIRHLLTY